jgi:hypothetical protein
MGSAGIDDCPPGEGVFTRLLPRKAVAEEVEQARRDVERAEREAKQAERKAELARQQAEQARHDADLERQRNALLEAEVARLRSARQEGVEE